MLPIQIRKASRPLRSLKPLSTLSIAQSFIRTAKCPSYRQLRHATATQLQSRQRLSLLRQSPRTLLIVRRTGGLECGKSGVGHGQQQPAGSFNFPQERALDRRDRGRKGNVAAKAGGIAFAAAGQITRGNVVERAGQAGHGCRVNAQARPAFTPGSQRHLAAVAQQPKAGNIRGAEDAGRLSGLRGAAIEGQHGQNRAVEVSRFQRRAAV